MEGKHLQFKFKMHKFNNNLFSLLFFIALIFAQVLKMDWLSNKWCL